MPEIVTNSNIEYSQNKNFKLKNENEIVNNEDEIKNNEDEIVKTEIPGIVDNAHKKKHRHKSKTISLKKMKSKKSKNKESSKNISQKETYQHALLTCELFPDIVNNVLCDV